MIARRADGKVKIVKQHETPTRVGGVLGGGVGLATGVVVALFPFAAVGGGLLAAAGGGAVLGAVAGHVVAGMRRGDLKELGEHLDAGQAGLVVVGISDMGSKIEQAMHHAEKLEARESSRPTPPRSKPTPDPPAPTSRQPGAEAMRFRRAVPEASMGSSVPARHLLFVLVCLVATACGNSGDDTSGAAPATTTTTAASGTTAAATQACADAAALKASVAELDQLDPAQAGKAGIQAALDKVQANLAALGGSATGQWGSQILSWTAPSKPSRPPLPGSMATACCRPCRRSSVT